MRDYWLIKDVSDDFPVIKDDEEVAEIQRTILESNFGRKKSNTKFRYVEPLILKF